MYLRKKCSGGIYQSPPGGPAFQHALILRILEMRDHSKISHNLKTYSDRIIILIIS